MGKAILNNEDLYRMLDEFLRDSKSFWEGFYEDRSMDIPFFKIQGPDENLVSYYENVLLPERVLELGCGPGRNAIYMTQMGSRVDALDISENAISWAKERAEAERVAINFHCTSVFDFECEPHSYDFIYDCGLLHHLPPHRRIAYLEIVKKALKNDGHFGIVSFNTKGAPDTPDWEVYAEKSMKGGIGYSEERLKEVFANDFQVIEFREMKKMDQESGRFGEDFLWAGLMRVQRDR
ncbi:class I SAM-dependent methyltransferase [Bacillus haimaensis]|uniref:class I SAM-dependent methyltransferase n=1 Tax=Bacillus haimaensis TaxID=3160967 RepID=UPI003AA8B1C3